MGWTYEDQMTFESDYVDSILFCGMLDYEEEEEWRNELCDSFHEEV